MSAEPTMPPLMRALPELHLANLANELGLHEFAERPKERQRKHLAGVEDAKQFLSGRIGFAPPDGMLRKAVALTLEVDQSFRAYVVNKGGGGHLTSDAGSMNVLLAGAGAILCRYFKVQEAS